MKNFDYNEYLGMAGIKTGSIIDVSSALSTVKKFSDVNQLSFNADLLIDELKSIVGINGTVMIRAFAWSFCKGLTFNVRETPSEVGVLGNIAMKRNDFIRTSHPLYSWMVWGKYQNELCNLNYTDGLGEDSIFAFLEKNKSHQLLIGKQQIAGLTIGHYVEQKMQVPYRCRKYFEGEYIDREGIVSHRRYSMYVRPLNIDVENIFGKEQVQKTMSEEGIRKNYLYKDSVPLATINLPLAAKFVSEDIRCNDGRQTVVVNGIHGINSSGVDWSMAKYY